MLLFLLYIVLGAMVLDYSLRASIPPDFAAYYADELNQVFGGIVVYIKWIRFYE